MFVETSTRRTIAHVALLVIGLWAYECRSRDGFSLLPATVTKRVRRRTRVMYYSEMEKVPLIRRRGDRTIGKGTDRHLQTTYCHCRKQASQVDEVYQMKFPCKACGKCCQHTQGHPHLDRGDGICRHYDEQTRFCAIYDNRPVACSVEKAAVRLEGVMSAKVFYMAQANACVAYDPDNADMPQLTETALRDAGLFDGTESLDVQEFGRLVRENLAAKDYLPEA
jgi:Fe-S-cluster containining protein